MSRIERWVTLSVACGLAALMVGCAGVPRDPSMPINDPNEQFNRGVLKLNQAVLDPASQVVQAVSPGPALNRARDLDSNLKEPRIFANDILQGRFNAAGITFGRFVMNSTFGLGGLFDIATPGGLPQQSGDFGQTLFVWGVTDGPFVERPYFGPATARDAVGGLVDTAADPAGWTLERMFGWRASVGTTGLDAYAHLGDWKRAESSSIDFYSFLRSSYYQTRRAQLREGLGLPPAMESPATESPATESPAAASPPPRRHRAAHKGAAAAPAVPPTR
jgi:phospholipid-binding lipoprotein MlaA